MTTFYFRDVDLHKLSLKREELRVALERADMYFLCEPHLDVIGLDHDDGTTAVYRMFVYSSWEDATSGGYGRPVMVIDADDPITMIDRALEALEA